MAYSGRSPAQIRAIHAEETDKKRGIQPLEWNRGKAGSLPSLHVKPPTAPKAPRPPSLTKKTPAFKVPPISGRRKYYGE